MGGGPGGHTTTAFKTSLLASRIVQLGKKGGQGFWLRRCGGLWFMAHSFRHQC